MIAPVPHFTFRRLLCVVAVVLGLLSLASSTQAQTYWSGVASSDWYDSRNWYNGGVPTSNTDVVISAPQMVDRGYWYSETYACGYTWPTGTRYCTRQVWQSNWGLGSAPVFSGAVVRSLRLLGGATLTLYGPFQCGDLTIERGGSLQALYGSTVTVTGTLNVAAALTAGTVTVGGNMTINQDNFTVGAGGVVFNGSGDQSVQFTGSGTASLTKMTLDKPSGVFRVSADLPITSGLTISRGMIETTASAAVIIPAGSSITGERTGHYVKGNLLVRANNVSGPTDFGNGVSIDATSSLGNVSVKRTAGLRTAGVSYGTNPATGLLKGIDQIWEITPQVQPAAPVEVTFSWWPENDNGLTFAKARVWKQETTGPNWQAAGGVTDARGRYITVDAASFSRWTVSNEANPLPVELTRFSATPTTAQAVRLAWATASEKNSRAFEVERGPDGRTFQRIGTVAAAGTSTSARSYELVDALVPLPARTLVYYRLKQVDIDGTFTYSPVRVVTLLEAEASLRLVPNPAVGHTSTLVGTRPGAAVRVLDALGRTVATATADASGAAVLTLRAGLPAGVYLVHAGQQTRRLVVE